MLMEMSIKEIGKMIKLMVKELIHMLMEHIIMEIGLKINSMDLEWNLGLMEQNMKENIKMVRKMEEES